MAFARRDIRGGAVQTTIVGDITSGSASCSLTATTGWPDGSTNGSFYVVIDPGTASEEKILCTTRSSGTLNFGTRGADGTTAAAHAAGAVIYPIGAATDFDEANLAVSETIGKVTTAGDMLVASGANAFQRLAKGSNSTVLNVSSGGSVGWGTVTSAMITDGTIATGDIADSQVTNAKLAGMTRGTVKVGNASGVASDLALGTSGYYLKSDGTDAVWASIGNIAKGQLSGGYAEITSSATLTGATTTDISGLSVTVTIEASRLYKITVYCAGVTTGNILLRESSTTLQALFVPAGTVTGTVGACVWRGTPSAGSHTYKASSTHSGTGSWQAAATSPSFIMVEDIGPA